MIDNKIDQLANYVIRPRKRQYNQSDLGPKFFKSKCGLCVRSDFQVQFSYECANQYTVSSSSKHQQQHIKDHPKKPIYLKCSVFTSSVIDTKIPKKVTKTQSLEIQQQESNYYKPQQSICVLALHGNTGSRMSTLNSLQAMISSGVSYAIFDFAGCGNSEGQYVTLGFYQKYQIAAVLKYLHNNFGFFKFILYGRSMGAASALFYSSQVYPLYSKSKQKQIKKYYQAKLKQKNQLLHISPNKTPKKYGYSPKVSYKQHKQRQICIDIIKKLDLGYFGYQIVGLIADSPYYDAKQMIMDLVKNRLWICPNFVTNFLLNKVNEKVINKLQITGISKLTGKKQYKQQNGNSNISLRQMNKFNAQQQNEQYMMNQRFSKSSSNLNQNYNYNSNSSYNSNYSQSNNKSNVSKNNQQTPNQSFIQSIKIPRQTYIPFPVFVLYGLEDDIISKNHTLQLFKRIICQHKKLHILQNQGHGNHREQAVKIHALQWVLGFEYERIGNRVERDAELLGMNVQELNKCLLQSQLENLHKYWNTNSQNYSNYQNKYKQRCNQRSTEVGSQRTQSLASIKQKYARQHIIREARQKDQQSIIIDSVTHIQADSPSPQQFLYQSPTAKQLSKITPQTLLRMSRVNPYNTLNNMINTNCKSRFNSFIIARKQCLISNEKMIRQ